MTDETMDTPEKKAYDQVELHRDYMRLRQAHEESAKEARAVLLEAATNSAGRRASLRGFKNLSKIVESFHKILVDLINGLPRYQALLVFESGTRQGNNLNMQARLSTSTDKVPQVPPNPIVYQAEPRTDAETTERHKIYAQLMKENDLLLTIIDLLLNGVRDLLKGRNAGHRLEFMIVLCHECWIYAQLARGELALVVPTAEHSQLGAEVEASYMVWLDPPRGWLYHTVLTKRPEILSNVNELLALQTCMVKNALTWMRQAKHEAGVAEDLERQRLEKERQEAAKLAREKDNAEGRERKRLKELEKAEAQKAELQKAEERLAAQREKERIIEAKKAEDAAKAKAEEDQLAAELAYGPDLNPAQRRQVQKPLDSFLAVWKEFKDFEPLRSIDPITSPQPPKIPSVLQKFFNRKLAELRKTGAQLEGDLHKIVTGETSKKAKNRKGGQNTSKKSMPPDFDTAKHFDFDAWVVFAEKIQESESMSRLSFLLKENPLDHIGGIKAAISPALEDLNIIISDLNLTLPAIEVDEKRDLLESNGYSYQNTMVTDWCKRKKATMTRLVKVMPQDLLCRAVVELEIWFLWEYSAPDTNPDGINPQSILYSLHALALLDQKQQMAGKNEEWTRVESLNQEIKATVLQLLESRTAVKSDDYTDTMPQQRNQKLIRAELDDIRIRNKKVTSHFNSLYPSLSTISEKLRYILVLLGLRREPAHLLAPNKHQKFALLARFGILDVQFPKITFDASKTAAETTAETTFRSRVKHALWGSDEDNGKHTHEQGSMAIAYDHELKSQRSSNHIKEWNLITAEFHLQSLILKLPAWYLLIDPDPQKKKEADALQEMLKRRDELWESEGKLKNIAGSLAAARTRREVKTFEIVHMLLKIQNLKEDPPYATVSEVIKEQWPEYNEAENRIVERETGPFNPILTAFDEIVSQLVSDANWCDLLTGARDPRQKQLKRLQNDLRQARTEPTSVSEEKQKAVERKYRTILTNLWDAFHPGCLQEPLMEAILGAVEQSVLKLSRSRPHSLAREVKPALLDLTRQYQEINNTLRLLLVLFDLLFKPDFLHKTFTGDQVSELLEDQLLRIMFNPPIGELCKSAKDVKDLFKPLEGRIWGETGLLAKLAKKEVLNTQPLKILFGRFLISSTIVSLGYLVYEAGLDPKLKTEIEWCKKIDRLTRDRDSHLSPHRVGKDSERSDSRRIQDASQVQTIIVHELLEHQDLKIA